MSSKHASDDISLESTESLDYPDGELLGLRVLRDFASDFGSTVPIYFVGIISEYRPSREHFRISLFKHRKIVSLDAGLYRIHYLDGGIDDMTPQEALDGVSLYNSTKEEVSGKDLEDKFLLLRHPNPSFDEHIVQYEHWNYWNLYREHNLEVGIEEPPKPADDEENKSEGMEEEEKRVLTTVGFVPSGAFCNDIMTLISEKPINSLMAKAQKAGESLSGHGRVIRTPKILSPDFRRCNHKKVRPVGRPKKLPRLDPTLTEIANDSTSTTEEDMSTESDPTPNLTLGVKGVTYKDGKYQARKYRGKKQYFLGTFETEKEAADAIEVFLQWIDKSGVSPEEAYMAFKLNLCGSPQSSDNCAARKTNFTANVNGKKENLNTSRNVSGTSTLQLSSPKKELHVTGESSNEAQSGDCEQLTTSEAASASPTGVTDSQNSSDKGAAKNAKKSTISVAAAASASPTGVSDLPVQSPSHTEMHLNEQSHERPVPPTSINGYRAWCPYQGMKIEIGRFRTETKAKKAIETFQILLETSTEENLEKKISAAKKTAREYVKKTRSYPLIETKTQEKDGVTIEVEIDAPLMASPAKTA